MRSAENAKALREQGQSTELSNDNQILHHPTGDVNSTDLSAAAQRQRLLLALRNGPITTLDARSGLEILHPAARVMELRKIGYQIDTVRVSQATDTGVKHSIAKYVLVTCPADEGTNK